MKNYLKYFMISFLLFSVFQVKAQTFSFVKIAEYENLNAIIDSTENSVVKAIFIDDNSKLLYEKGMPVFDKKMQTGYVADVKGVSREKYQSPDGEYNLPYIKIRFDNTNYWTHGIYPFIFDDARPDVSFESQGVKYNVYSAKSMCFLSEGIYLGYEVVVLKNTSTNEYKLLTCNRFPKALDGHSYGLKFVYLQNDNGVNEKITESSTEIHLANLNIDAKYQEGGATYTISFKPADEKPEAKYWNIRIKK